MITEEELYGILKVKLVLHRFILELRKIFGAIYFSTFMMNLKLYYQVINSCGSFPCLMNHIVFFFGKIMRKMAYLVTYKHSIMYS